MGGGIGISAHASHRVVTERAMLAMPETTIGLVPDVGGMWLLAQAPGHFGEYLGLLGERMNAADAIVMGFADTSVQRRARLTLSAPWSTPKATRSASRLRASPTRRPPSGLTERQDSVDRIFRLETARRDHRKRWRERHGRVA